MKRLFTILLILISLSVQVHGQKWFSDNSYNEKIKGYIIGIAGDTIQGFIEYNYPIVMQKRVSFYKNENGAENTTYKPEDIRGYSLKNVIWHSVKVAMDTYNGIYNFNRFGILESDPGPVTLLRIFEEKDKQKKKVSSEEAEKRTDHVTPTRDGKSLDNLYIRKFEEPAELLTTRDFKRNFIEKMRHYVGDYNDLMDRIESKMLELEDIDQIIKEYNNWYLKKFKK